MTSDKKLWLLLAASFLAGLLTALFRLVSIDDAFGQVLALVMLSCLAFSWGMLALARRLGRPDVSAAERFARRLLFQKPPSS